MPPTVETPTMDTPTPAKAFTVLDTRYDSPVFGFEDMPASTANFEMLASVAGQKDWRSLDAGESVCVKDRAGEIYRMVRTR